MLTVYTHSHCLDAYSLFTQASCEHHGAMMVEAFDDGRIAVLLHLVSLRSRGSRGNPVALQVKVVQGQHRVSKWAQAQHSKIELSDLIEELILQTEEVHQRVLHPLDHHRP